MMKFSLILPAVFVGTCAAAQTPATNAPPAAPKPHVVEVAQPDQPPAPETDTTSTLDPAKIAEYQKRFQQGYALEQAGQLADALKIYEGILAEQPQAKRSLLEAGRICFKLNDLVKADAYLGKLHSLVPDFPDATEMLIQVNQALKHDVKVELLLRDFRALHDSGKVPQFTQSLVFVREQFALGQDQVIVSQFFDYTKDPNTVWMAEVYNPNGDLKRRLLLNYDPAGTAALRAKDAKYAGVQVFTWFEHKILDGRVKEIDAYLQIFALPEYQKFRSAMLIILADPPKPIYSAPVDVSAAPTNP
jgi:tetratricopeptide (TPR) repeat protein